MDVCDSKARYKKIKQVLWVILFANLGVAILKIIIGKAINSTSMMADGFHSITDGASNIVGLVGIGLAAKPVDDDHPYGHRKFEILAGMIIAGMLFFIGAKVVFDAILGFSNPSVPHITMESLVTLILTIIINIFVSKYEFRQGKKLENYVLISDSIHTKSDVYISIGVLTALFGISIGLPPIIDPIVSLVVAGFIFHACFEIFSSASSVLVDKVAVDIKKIEEIVKEFDEVKDMHKIRSRGTEEELYIDMHVMVDPEISVQESHKLIHNIEEKMKEKINPNVQTIIHIEPYYEENLPCVDESEDKDDEPAARD